MASSEQRCVTDLLAEKLPVPLTDRWLITAAQINLYYPPGPGKVQPKVITVEVTRKGRLNLQSHVCAVSVLPAAKRSDLQRRRGRPDLPVPGVRSDSDHGK